MPGNYKRRTDQWFKGVPANPDTRAYLEVVWEFRLWCKAQGISYVVGVRRALMAEMDRSKR